MYDPPVSLPTDPAESGNLVTIEIDEHEHQALDLLDEQPRGLSQDAVSGEVRAAEDVVRRLLLRLGTAVARTLIDAASELARTEDRGSLEVGALDEMRLTLVERPRLSLAITPAVEILGTVLGLDRDAAAWVLLLELAEQAHAQADERLHNCSTVAQAGPSIRAQVLTADHPEHLGLARVLVDLHADAATLVDAFDQARETLEAAAVERPKPEGPPQIDGPKRKFTRVHVILALIVLGLTLWHYVFR
jgi:hypothetical protein